MNKVGEGYIYSTSGSPILELIYKVGEGYIYSTSGFQTLELMNKVGEGYIYIFYQWFSNPRPQIISEKDIYILPVVLKL